MRHEKGCGRRRAELLQVDLLLVPPVLNRQALSFMEESVYRGVRITEVEFQTAEMEIQARFGSVVGVSAVAGRGAEARAGQVFEVVVLETTLWFIGEELREAISKTMNRVTWSGSFGFRGFALNDRLEVEPELKVSAADR